MAQSVNMNVITFWAYGEFVLVLDIRLKILLSKFLLGKKIVELLMVIQKMMSSDSICAFSTYDIIKIFILLNLEM